MYPRDPPRSPQPGYPPQQGGYPPQQGGYPPQQGGYPPHQGGYPPQQGGYPPQQGGYPPQQGGYPPQQGGYPGYPSGGDIGFSNFPSQENTYPGYPPAQSGGYPPAQSGGYPPAQSGGYPPYQPGGYPPAQSGGYPPAQPGGYPAGNNNSQYPPFNPNAGAPSQPGHNPSLYPFLPGTSGPGAASFNPTASTAGNVNYPKPSYQGTVTEMPNNSNDDAATLYKAMKGFGTDEKKIIDVLCRRTSRQRQEILLAYKAGYGKDLVANLKSELSGNFEDLVVALMMTPAQLEARDLQRAIDGMGIIS